MDIHDWEFRVCSRGLDKYFCFNSFELEFAHGSLQRLSRPVYERYRRNGSAPDPTGAIEEGVENGIPSQTESKS